MSDFKDTLKDLIQDLINDKPEQAQATVHQYFLAKTQEIVEGKSAPSKSDITCGDCGGSGPKKLFDPSSFTSSGSGICKVCAKKDSDAKEAEKKKQAKE